MSCERNVRKHIASLARQPAQPAVFRTKTRDEWCGIMEGTDVCFAPVLSIGEAPAHPHARARGAYVDVN